MIFKVKKDEVFSLCFCSLLTISEEVKQKSVYLSSSRHWLPEGVYDPNCCFSCVRECVTSIINVTWQSHVATLPGLSQGERNPNEINSCFDWQV